jgi:hypothetical protein
MEELLGARNVAVLAARADDRRPRPRVGLHACFPHVLKQLEGRVLLSDVPEGLDRRDVGVPAASQSCVVEACVAARLCVFEVTIDEKCLM